MIRRQHAGWLACLMLLAGCGLHSPADSATASGRAAPRAASAPVTASDPSYAVPDPGKLRGGVRSADILVVGSKSLSEKVRKRVRELRSVRAAQPLSVASVALGERTITVAGADLSAYRRFTAEATAEHDEVWRRIASGEAALTRQIGRDLRQPLGGTMVLRTASDQHRLRIGAYATTVPHIDAVVNERRALRLGMKADNALLVSVRSSAVHETVDAVENAVGKAASVHPLTEEPPESGTRRAAYLTGGAVAKAVGSFRYEYFADGTVEPESRWVRANIRTEPVPILGTVTCHRVMLPQLRAALTEIVERDLADRINPGDFGGCYVPRFIGHDIRKGLSLHTWGIAVDLNVRGNQRGTSGEIDREVVAIFKRWGFAWGGDWQWTDPMHFELTALVR